MINRRTKARQNRERWRSIFIWIIGLTIPCYMFGFFVWFINPSIGSRPRTTETPDVTATWTPIDPNALLTQLALTNPAATNTVSPLASPTELPNVGFTLAPVVTNPVDLFNSPTPIPTRFITQTPSPTSNIPTATPTTQAPPTQAPTATQPVILPPTDTPNP